MGRNKSDFQRMSAMDILATHDLAENVEPDAEITDPRTLLNKKYEAATNSGLKDSILKHGVTKPIILIHDGDNKMMYDGHHRLAVMMRHAPSTPIPVTIHTDMESAGAAWEKL
jgi:ParB-like chromosome segregation protein Spo0J